MHEIGLVDDMLCVINAKLKGLEGSSRVKCVNILIGELEHITSGHFEFHFRERTKGTFLENAELKFKKVEAVFKCKDCLREFSAKDDITGCPDCCSKLNDIIAGSGISVESIEVV